MEGWAAGRVGWQVEGGLSRREDRSEVPDLRDSFYYFLNYLFHLIHGLRPLVIGMLQQ